MQITKGTVSLTINSNIVVGDANTNWSAVPIGSLFIRAGQPVNYQVAAAPVVNAAGFWQLTLTANYGGATEKGANYALQTSFTANGLPLWNVGDTETVALINRLTATVEALISGLGGSAAAATFVQQVATLAANADTIPNISTNPPTRQKIAAQGAGMAMTITLPQ